MLTQHEEKVQCSCAHSATPCLIGSQKSARLHWFVANMIPSGYVKKYSENGGNFLWNIIHK